MAKKPLERHIQNEIKRFINQSGRAYVWRQNTGAHRQGDRWISYGMKGQADLSGMLKDGRRLEVEVKRPGCKQTDCQKKFQALVEEFGGVYLVAESVEEVARKLELGYLF